MSRMTSPLIGRERRSARQREDLFVIRLLSVTSNVRTLSPAFSINMIHGCEVKPSLVSPFKSDAWTSMGEDVSQWIAQSIHSEEEEEEDSEDSEDEWQRIA